MFGWFGSKKDKTIPIEDKIIIPIKDRNDRKKCKSSTKWKNETYCPYCFKETDHDERMTDICLSCGSYDERLSRRNRVFRKIWNGKSWIVQRSYKNKLFIAGEECGYKKRTYPSGEFWQWKAFVGEILDEKSEIPVLENGELFIYKKDSIE